MVSIAKIAILCDSIIFPKRRYVPFSSSPPTTLHSSFIKEMLYISQELSGPSISELTLYDWSPDLTLSTHLTATITQDYESKYSLSDYTEVTIAEIWNNPSAYNGQKVKIIGYVGCYELDNCFDAYLVKEKDIAKMDTDPDNILETYNYWLNSLKWLHQYIGFRIPLNSYMQQVPSNSPQINAGSKVALYGTFTYNASYVDEGKRTSNAPHGYDILVDKFMVINIG